MANEPIQSGPYPLASNAPDGPAQIKAVVDWAAPLLNMRFASVAARDAAITIPVDGMECCTGTGAAQQNWRRTNGAWAWDGPSGATMGAPITTVANGSAATTSWVQDIYSGSYAFIAVAGRRYRAILDGLQFSSTVAGDKFLFAICNGGAAVATPGAGIVANGYVVVSAAGTAGQVAVPLCGSFVPGAGTVTLSVNLIRIAGTGVGTPSSVPGGVGRDLYAVDLGPA